MATFLRSMPGIYRNDRNTDALGFVLNKGPQLIERPFAELFSLLSSNRFPKALEIFDPDGSFGVFGNRNDSFTDNVVRVPLEPGFSPGEFFEMPLGRFAASFLKGGFDPGHANADNIDRSAGEVLSVGSRGDVLDSHIDAEKTLGLSRRRSIGRQLDVKKENAIFSLHENRRGRMLSKEGILLSDSEFALDSLAGMEQGQAESPVPFPEGKNASVVINAHRGKDGMRFGWNLERRAYPGDGSNGQIGRQAKALPDFPIAGLLDLDFIGRMDLSGDFGDSVASCGKCLERRVNLGALRGRRIQFANDSSDQFHTRKLITLKTHMQGTGDGASSPRMNPGASAPGIW